MFENFSFDGPVVARRADSPAYSPTECPSWEAPSPRPAHILADARKYSLTASLAEVGLEPSTESRSSTSHHLSKPSSTRRAHSTNSATRRSPQSDIRLQRIFLTQMQCLAGSSLVEFSVRRFGDASGDESVSKDSKPRKFSAGDASWRRGAVEKSALSAGCGKRRKAVMGVRGKWSLNEGSAALEAQAQ